MLLLQRVLDGLFAQCDVVVQTSPIPFDIIGLPLIAFPIGFEESRGTPLPVAGMLGGLPFGEERLLSLVAAYQAVTDWHRRRPADAPASGGPGERGAEAPHRLDVLDVLESCQ
jgi:amidase/aspartyl-tRNA(Asn)/glutamyl-tRNA(Gln) amidotransferase subunit A